MMGIRRVSDAEREISNTLLDKAKSAKEALIQKRKNQKRAYNATEIRFERKNTEMHFWLFGQKYVLMFCSYRLAERQLLGKLHEDHKYLRKFVNSSLLKKAYAVHGEDELPNTTHSKVITPPQEC